MTKALRYLGVYALWSIQLVLGVWFLLIGREVLTTILGIYAAGNFARGYQGGFLDKIFTITLGLGWFTFVLVAEEFLRRSVRKGKILLTFSRFTAIELFLAFGTDGVLLLLNGFASGYGRLFILAGELILGILLAYLGWSKQSPWVSQHQQTP